MFAVIKTGGKQYRVAPADLVEVEKLSGAAGDAVAFGDVLMVGDEDGVAVGSPTVAGATVAGEIVRQQRTGQDPRLQEAPPAEFQAQPRAPPGADPGAHHRDPHRRQGTGRKAARKPTAPAKPKRTRAKKPAAAPEAAAEAAADADKE